MGKPSDLYGFPVQETERSHRQGRRLKLYLSLVISTLGLLWWSVQHYSIVADGIPNWLKGCEHNPIENVTFRWIDVVPSKQLRYAPCFNGFECARLDVPLNWNASTGDAGLRAAVAITKLPARVAVTDPRYGGAILINPGGPGESGVHQVLEQGQDIQRIVDSSEDPSLPATVQSTAKYFDIIGFDPRGVNNTMPRLKCFPDAFNHQAWTIAYLDYGLLWDSESLLGLEWARAKALGASCSRESDADDMVRYVNTAQVVEDVLEIVERHGEWRQEEAQRKVQVLGAKWQPRVLDNILERTSWKKGQEKLQYWGLSYGTVIGETFAAMHPDRVARVIIDGVVDPIDHYNGDWLTNLVDADKIIHKLCDYCYEAGPERCPLYTGNSGRDVEARLTKIMMDLKDNPIPVPASSPYGPEVVTYGDVYLRMLSAMYFGFTHAENWFALLAEVEQGNATSLAEMKQGMVAAVEIPSECQQSGPFSDACVSSNYVSFAGTIQSVGCMDVAGRNANITKEEFKEYLTILKGQSKWISASWARNKLFCLGYTVSPAWTFEGPIAGNTSHPLLIIGNTHDTVTPIQNARHTSTLFPGSVVLHHDSQGHCSYSNPSLCTGKIIRNYFQTGALPSADTKCVPEYRPFVGCQHKMKGGSNACRVYEPEEEALWTAMKSMAGVFT